MRVPRAAAARALSETQTGLRPDEPSAVGSHVFNQALVSSLEFSFIQLKLRVFLGHTEAVVFLSDL